MSGNETKYDEKLAQHARDQLNKWMGDMTEAEAAKLLGVNQSTVHRNRKPNNQPTFKFLIQLAKATGKTIDEIIGLRHETEPKVLMSESAVMRITKAIVDEVRKLPSVPPPPPSPTKKTAKKRAR